MSTDELDQKKKDFSDRLQKFRDDLKNAQTQTQIDTLKGDLSFISNLAQELGIAFDASAIEQSMNNKAQAKNVTNAVDQMLDQERESEEAIKQEKERAEKAEKIYKEFDEISPAYLKQQDKENKDLDEALEAMKSGKGISNELKAKLNKTPKEIEEDREKWEKIHNARNTAQSEYKHHANEIKKIDEEISKLNSKAHSVEIKSLNQKKDFHVEKKQLAQSKIDETAKHYEKRQQAANIIIEAKQNAKSQSDKDWWDDREKIFQGIHKVPTEIAKHPIAVIEQTGKIKQELKKENINTKNKDRDKTQEQHKAQNKENDKSKTQNQNNKKAPNKNTQQWSI